ncbi:MAG: glycerol-3-phosphate 1-O-acyltransferase PlsY [Hyphomicrobiales bacterium]|nr:glycerol-3-phosphate 1-O-acyltransferase PlsY [Hyphomicrobiales bacterium]
MDFNAMTVTHQLAGLLGYLLGSIPFGLVLTRLAGLGDIRAIGSGNIGATNVLRTGNKALAAATLLLDGGKGAVAALALWAAWGYEFGLLGGLFAVIGHNFPVWLRFKGGKGVATTLGVLLAIAWPVGILACLTWLVVAAVFRYSSLAALVALAASPFYMVWLATPPAAVVAALLALLGFVRHHANIRRLLAGEEPKIGQKKKADGDAGGGGTDGA